MWYSCSCFVTIISGNTEQNLLLSRPVLPFAENSNGLKHPCSTFITLSLYFVFFSFSFEEKYRWRLWLAYLIAIEHKTLVSKILFNLMLKIPLLLCLISFHLTCWLLFVTIVCLSAFVI